jgi:vacuolar-type H+-ATPase subunit E/Vma4
MPEDFSYVEAILTATAHVHTVEQAYTELLERVPEALDTFNQQYRDWVKSLEAEEAARTETPSFLKWLYRALRRK